MQIVKAKLQTSSIRLTFFRFAFFNFHFAFCNKMAEPSLAEELKRIAGLKVKLDEPLARYTTFKIGGPADYFLDVESRQALIEVLRLLTRDKVPFHLLGKGSNVLVSDRGVRGAVIRLGGEFKRVEWREEGDAVLAHVGAAYP